jgi:hypothetical protein
MAALVPEIIDVSFYDVVQSLNSSRDTGNVSETIQRRRDE